MLANALPGEPLDVLDAETEGQIGYVLAVALSNALPSSHEVVCVLTRAVVDRGDPAFGRPSKPVGPWYGREEAARLAADKGWAVADAGGGRGWRRIVPSPAPTAVVEARALQTLLAGGFIPVCGGGGGVPVAAGADGRWAGVEAVVDKARERCGLRV